MYAGASGGGGGGVVISKTRCSPWLAVSWQSIIKLVSVFLVLMSERCSVYVCSETVTLCLSARPALLFTQQALCYNKEITLR